MQLIFLCSSLVMHVQASPRTLHLASVSSAGDVGPFSAACALSLGLVVFAIIKLCGYFFQTTRCRLRQLVLSIFSLMSCAALLGLVLSRAYAKHQGAYLGLLYWISSLAGVWESEILWSMSWGITIPAIRVEAQSIGIYIASPLCISIVAGFIGSMIHYEDSQTPFIILQFAANFAVYVFLCIGYTFLLFVSKSRKEILLSMGAPCSLMLIAGVVLSQSLKESIHWQVIWTWVFVALSNVLPIRVDILRELGFLVRYEPNSSGKEQSSATVHNIHGSDGGLGDSSQNGSSVALVEPAAAHVHD